jgi:putative ABC transport system permease protein
VSFLALQKSNEIGARKVLGANLISILWLFTKELGRLLLIAFMIAAPIAGWAMNAWLQDFQYRIPISWEVFGTAIGSTYIIGLLTVDGRSLKSARANPVKILRTE